MLLNYGEKVIQLLLLFRAFYTDKLGVYEKMMTELFGFDRLLPMNTGVEGGESAVKFARKWGYKVKKIPEGAAKVFFKTIVFQKRVCLVFLV